MADNRRIGAAGEVLAAQILESKGYYIIRKNFSCKYGEIDIIAAKGRELCFIEVKTRTSDCCGSPGEAVDLKKQRHIKNVARYFLSQYKRPYDNVDFQVMEVVINHIVGLEF